MAVYAEPLNPPQPAPGLLTAASVAELPAHASFDGLEFRPDMCGLPHLLAGMVCVDNLVDHPTKEFDDIDGLVEAVNYIAYTSETCTPIGMSLRDAEGRVRRRLDAKEQWAVERAFIGEDGYLPGLGLTSLGSTASLPEAVGALEQAVATAYGLPALLHAPAAVAAFFGANGQLIDTPVNQLQRTWKGSPVVFGDGYQNVDVDGVVIAAAGTYTLWATGRVRVWRSSDVLVADPRQTLDRSTNQTYILAEREFAIAHECVAFAVTVTGLGTGLGG